MTKLEAFLHPDKTYREKEVIISDRFPDIDDNGNPITDENGKIVPQKFKIRAIMQAENETILERCNDKNGKPNMKKYNREIVLCGTVYPDFSSAEFSSVSRIPSEVAGIILTSGEFARLEDEILRFSGFSESAASVTDEAKNF